MVRMSALAGFDHVIGFDMGGTSADVSHYAERVRTRLLTQVAGVRLRAPMLDIHTVAAGGSRFCISTGGRYRSAGLGRPHWRPGLLPRRPLCVTDTPT